MGVLSCSACRYEDDGTTLFYMCTARRLVELSCSIYSCSWKYDGTILFYLQLAELCNYFVLLTIGRKAEASYSGYSYWNGVTILSCLWLARWWYYPVLHIYIWEDGGTIFFYYSWQDDGTILFYLLLAGWWNSPVVSSWVVEKVASLTESYHHDRLNISNGWELCQISHQGAPHPPPPLPPLCLTQVHKP